MWHVGDCSVHVCVCEDVGMVIRKSIVVSFLPYLVSFLGFHPYTYVISFF